MGAPSKSGSRRAGRSASSRRRAADPANSIEVAVQSATESLSAKDAVPRGTLPPTAPVPAQEAAPKKTAATASTVKETAKTETPIRSDNTPYTPLVLIEPVIGKTEIYTKGKPGCCKELDYEAYTALHMGIIKSLGETYYERSVTPPSEAIKVSSKTKK